MALLRERGRNTETIEYRTGRFVSGCQMVQYSNDGTENRTEKCLFMIQNVQYSNG